MPLPNNKEIQWNGYLVDSLAGATERFVANLEQRLKTRDLPSVSTQRATVNMWWRRGSLCLDVQSNLDGSVACTVHAMDYGTALFVGIAFNSSFLTDNYYKRMAATCFLESLDRCVHEAVEETATAMQRGVSPVTQIGRSGKCGSTDIVASPKAVFSDAFQSRSPLCRDVDPGRSRTHSELPVSVTEGNSPLARGSARSEAGSGRFGEKVT